MAHGREIIFRLCTYLGDYKFSSSNGKQSCNKRTPSQIHMEKLRDMK
jgi:hypothetical protein